MLIGIFYNIFNKTYINIFYKNININALIVNTNKNYIMKKCNILIKFQLFIFLHTHKISSELSAIDASTL